MRKIPMILAALGAIAGLAIRQRRRNREQDTSSDQYASIPGQFTHPQDAP